MSATKLCILWALLEVLAIGRCRSRSTPAVAHDLPCPAQCRCAAMDTLVDCRGDNVTFSRLYSTLPSNLTHFTFTAESHRSDGGGDWMLFSAWHGGFSKFTELEVFTIQLGEPTEWSIFMLGGNWAFCGLSRLEELRLTVRLRWPGEVLGDLFRRDDPCLPHLRLLDFSGTRSFDATEIAALVAGLHGKPLEVLRLRAFQKVPALNNLNTLDFDKLFGSLKGSRLKELDLSDNGISDLAPGLIKNLPHLEKLVLSGNFLLHRSTDSSTALCAEFFLHPTLEYVDISGQRMGGYVDETSIRRECSIPIENIRALMINTSALCDTVRCFLRDMSNTIPCAAVLQRFQQVQISKLFDFSCMHSVKVPIGRNLREVRAGGHDDIAKLKMPDAGKYCLSADNSLRVFDVTGMPRWDGLWDGITIGGAHHVHVLRAANLNGIFRQGSFFAGFPDLRELHLAGNRVQLDSNMSLFLHNDKLELLDLSGNGIIHIQPHQFAHLKFLKTLDLSGNLIRTVNFTLPSANPSALQLLRLNNNNICVVTRSFLSQLERYEGQLTLDLSANVLTCTCHEMYMIVWIQETRVDLIQKEAYQCQRENGQIEIIASIDLGLFSEECDPSIGVLVVGSCVSVAVFATVCILVVVIYRRRWRLRYGWYKLSRNTCTRPGPPPEAIELEDVYLYDGFVSYSSYDRQWVHQTLRQEMEERRDCRLFIYMRDMLGGGALVDRVHDAMADCRKHIFVLSPNFIASDPCMYELQSAQYKLMAEGLDVGILVMLEDLPWEQVPKSVVALIEMMGPLEWTNDMAGQKLFWDKLEERLLRPPKKIIMQQKKD